ncbi:helix-turn-helix domain-containing protein [Streptomyces sp. NPDC058155]|uniref:helix-turn-helix domain-containing protein n=1 Tax=Streptomyces sp. NPDC058155 TaxID=3346359 RepID=UPI0036ECC4EE
MPAPDRAGGESTARPITYDDRRRVRELHAQDKNHNEIARAIGRSPSTVSKIAGQFEPPLTLTPPKSRPQPRGTQREGSDPLNLAAQVGLTRQTSGSR